MDEAIKKALEITGCKELMSPEELKDLKKRLEKYKWNHAHKMWETEKNTMEVNAMDGKKVLAITVSDQLSEALDTLAGAACMPKTRFCEKVLAEAVKSYQQNQQ